MLKISKFRALATLRLVVTDEFKANNFVTGYAQRIKISDTNMDIPDEDMLLTNVYNPETSESYMISFSVKAYERRYLYPY